MARAKTIYEDFWFVVFQKGNGDLSLRSLVNAQELEFKAGTRVAGMLAYDIEEGEGHDACKARFLDAAENKL